MKDANRKPSTRGQARLLRNALFFGICCLCLYLASIWQLHRFVAQSIENRNLSQAKWSLDQLSLLVPHSSEVSLLKARVNRLMGSLDEMHLNLSDAADYGASIELIAREKTLALAQTGQLLRSESILRRSLSKGSNDAAEICEALINGLLLNYRLGDAQQLLDAWEADAPSDPQPKYIRGQIAEQLGNNVAALDYYEAALASAPLREDILRRLFITFVSQHHYEKAEAVLSRIKSPPSGDVELGSAYAKYLAETGHSKESQSLLESLCEKQPDHREIKLLLAREYFQDGKSKQALSIIQSRLARNNADYEFRYLLAQVLTSEGNSEAKTHLEYVQRADEAFNKVRSALDQARESPQDADSRFSIGKNLMAFGFQKDGAGWLRSTLELSPMHREAHAMLAEYYDHEGLKTLSGHHREAIKRIDQVNNEKQPFTE